jgi:hypothetical protein
LTANSITTNNLEVNGGVHIDTSKYFDTIVIRRPTGFSGDDNFFMGFRELQCWVNNTNILFDNANDLTSNYALWSAPETSLGGLTSKLYDNTFVIPYDVIDTVNSSDIALIIKNIPLTSISTIQSLVLYSRTAGKQHNEGIAIELYNSADFTEILASTNIITEKRTIYRFDFPSIDTYTGGFATDDSSTQIISEGATINVENANFIPLMVEITGDVVVGGDLTAENLIVGSTNLITEINTKQDIITDGSLSIARTDGLLTALDSTAKLAVENTFTANQSITGNLSVSGLITQSNTTRFKAYYVGVSGVTSTVSSGNTIPYNTTSFDIGNGFNTSTNTYVVPVAGTYFFGGTWFKNPSTIYTVDYQKNGVAVKRNECQFSSGGFSVIPTFIIEDCVVGDEIRLRIIAGSIYVGYNTNLGPNGWNFFEGYRLG